MSNPVMPKRMQIETLKRIFKSLNPEADPETVDWQYEVDSTLTLPENRLELSIKFPTYKWFKDETELKSTKEETIKELEDMLSYMLTVVPEEAKEDFQKIFEDYISKVRYSLERKLKIAPLKREVVELRAKLEEAQAKRETPKPLPLRRGVQWTPRLEQRLKDTFEAMLRREGLSPTRFWAEYRLELEVIKALETEEVMIKAIEELAKEIIEREKAVPPPRVPTEAPPKPPPERIRVIRPEEEEEYPLAMPRVEVTQDRYAPQFPRRPSGIEIDQFWEKYTTDLMICGKHLAPRVRPWFREFFSELTFKSWNALLDAYQRLVESICADKLPKMPIDLIIGLPGIGGFLTICEGAEWLASQKWASSSQEIAKRLTEIIGSQVTAEEVKNCLKTAWIENKEAKEKGIYPIPHPNLIILSKEYLETLIGEALI